MIVHKTGNIFLSTCQTFICPIAVKDLLTTGIARQFRADKKFYGIYKAFRRQMKAGTPQLAVPILWKNPPIHAWKGGPTWMIYLPVKHTNNRFHQANLKVIRRALEAVALYAEEWGCQSLAVPAVGGGHHDYEVIRPILEETLGNMNILVELYAPWTPPPRVVKHKPATLARLAAQSAIANQDLPPAENADLPTS